MFGMVVCTAYLVVYLEFIPFIPKIHAFIYPIILFKAGVFGRVMIFVDYVRRNHKEADYENLEHAIELAIDRCIEENVLREFLMEHRTEVVKVVKLDYTFDRQITMEREDSRAEGHAEGLAEGRAEGNIEKLIVQICKKLKKGKSIEVIADDLEEEISAIEPVCQVAEQFAPEYDWQKVKERILEQRDM